MTTADSQSKPIRIERAIASAPILFTTHKATISIVAGTIINIDDVEHRFDDGASINLGDLVPGQNYGVSLDQAGQPFATPVSTNPLDAHWFAGFHFAPGGCAEGRRGGDSVPAINPYSIWDIGFRPACPDPRGMTLVETMGGGRFWADIYLLGVDHRGNGTSRHAAEIADGRSLPLLDHRTAVGIYADHGKRLLTYDEFRTATFGVTEKSSADRDPKSTGLDAARTSRAGLMQATGNLWVWGTDGDPDDPRPSLFGGSWISGSSAGSRCASLDYWPGGSRGYISARGGSDHMNPA
ncbi:hypothetical protein G6L46_10380 [Agrobacterium rhizogenes]|uniref:hypothetical protein n=1 Tax=Rhizobium rhizogenes TaxID=359 RepID=UPI001574C479|nr:hypothetical protein [Rhizobium rhizogenes]NTF87530.1 hypothetical protein [Rhizobium rhizogenes]